MEVMPAFRRPSESFAHSCTIYSRNEPCTIYLHNEPGCLFIYGDLFTHMRHKIAQNATLHETLHTTRRMLACKQVMRR